MQTARLAPLAIATLASVLTATVTGCTDVRTFEGSWEGPRVGAAEVLRVGFADRANATLEVETVDLGRFRATLTVSGDVISGAPIQELAAAEADVLSEITFNSGQPARVFVTLVPTTDGGGDATGFFSLHGEDRIELRILRGGASPLYGIFFLARP